MLGSMVHEGRFNQVNFDKFAQPILNEVDKQTWEQKFAAPETAGFGNGESLPPFPGKDGPLEQENCNVDSQNHTLFGVNIDSSPLLSNLVPSVANSSAEASNMPCAASCFQNSLYAVDEFSSVLQNAGEADPPPRRTFIKVRQAWPSVIRFHRYLTKVAALIFAGLQIGIGWETAGHHPVQELQRAEGRTGSDVWYRGSVGRPSKIRLAACICRQGE